MCNRLSLIFDQPFSILIFESQTDLISDLRSLIISFRKLDRYLPIYPLVFKNSVHVMTSINFWSTLLNLWFSKTKVLIPDSLSSSLFVNPLGVYPLVFKNSVRMYRVFVNLTSPCTKICFSVQFKNKMKTILKLITI